MKHSGTANTLKVTAQTDIFLFVCFSPSCVIHGLSGGKETDTCNILPLKPSVSWEIMKGIELVSAEIKISNGKLVMEIV